ncbi:MAG: MaoC family dehydratase N-terminal domain-containing protein [Candidatus Dormibacteria bacterium]
MSEQDVGRYAAAVGIARLAGGPVPPIYAAVYCLRPVLTAVFQDASLGIPPSGVIHSEQSLEWRGLVAVGDRLEAEGSISSVQVRRGLLFLELHVRAARSGRSTVCSGRTVLLLRGGA